MVSVKSFAFVGLFVAAASPARCLRLAAVDFRHAQFLDGRPWHWLFLEQLVPHGCHTGLFRLDEIIRLDAARQRRQSDHLPLRAERPVDAGCHPDPARLRLQSERHLPERQEQQADPSDLSRQRLCRSRHLGRHHALYRRGRRRHRHPDPRLFELLQDQRRDALSRRPDPNRHLSADLGHAAGHDRHAAAQHRFRQAELGSRPAPASLPLRMGAHRRLRL
jgi:hypothetical protein